MITLVRQYRPFGGKSHLVSFREDRIWTLPRAINPEYLRYEYLKAIEAINECKK